MEMDGPGPPRRGVTVLDGIAFVIGSALASVHIRSSFPEGGGSWGFVATIFVVLALTASGPFVLLLRHVPFRPRDRLRPGETLWAILGFPWTAGAVLRTIIPRRGADGLDTLIGIALALACLIAVRLTWVHWVAVEPDPSPASAEPWTEWVGFGLAVSWPIQCGLGLVLLGSP